ncbi:U3 small nucleolar RNA-associated protein 14 homolog A [Betta splendens]|uniref:U3 small nucleolar RNA-associated protein 14 homolog A n=1 Tax=Betta splendens TaxID=158456 RepID=A0A6P7LH13_BETSP|nr:U3 small nucleolar RNA-associated protein 14 homolog A [Betta splendens]
MANRSKKKAKKERKKSAASKSNVIFDDEDDRDLKEGDENIISEEEEEGDGDERKRQKLLEAISALGGKRKKKFGERSEAAVQMSEFTVNAQGNDDKIDLSDLLGTMEKTPAVSTKTKKQLKNLQQGKMTIESPISKQASERIQRNLAFQKAAADVSRWSGIIRQNRKAEQLIFPLNQEPSGPKTMEKIVTGWKAQTPLEQEVFALLSANNQPINDPILTPAEEASLKAMSLAEAKIRRAELQKARALQSYYEAKARRERKIKSKKYHKVHNKNKGKEFLKQFEEMVKTNPAGALEELNKMELARMQERMSLKHQNSGKWAKSKAIMAKYDEGARKAMQQQLELNKELTHKLTTSLHKDEEEEKDAAEEEVMPSFVNDAEQVLDPSNPWMRGKLSEDLAHDENVVVNVPSVVAAAPENTAEEEDEIVETEEETLLREFNSRRKLRQGENPDTGLVMSVDDKEEDHEAAADASELEEQELSEFTNILKGLAHNQCDADAEASAGNCDTQLDKPHDDLELLDQETVTDEAPVQPHSAPSTNNPQPSTEKEGKKRKRKRGIEITKVLTKETNPIQVPLIPTVQETEDTDEKMDQRCLIKEAFAGDDVVSDFLRDKKKQEEEGKPKVVDLLLPGWGEWGGIGLKPSRHKRKRFRIKTAPPPPRKDQHLPTVIISEKRNRSMSSHQVNCLPSPFENHLQFESTMRSPLGRTWNTERTIKKLTKPKVVTRLGAIIEPMAQEELMKDQKAESESSVASGKKRRKNNAK